MRRSRFSGRALKPSPDFAFGSPAAIAAPGAGGCFGFADPKLQVAYGYVHNRMGGTLLDSRDVALREALASALQYGLPQRDGTETHSWDPGADLCLLRLRTRLGGPVRNRIYGIGFTQARRR